MNTRSYAIFASMLVATATAWAENPPPVAHGPASGRQFGSSHGDFLGEDFFPPELVMHNQKAIGLKDDQVTAIKTEMQKVMQGVTDLQWQQSAESETMASLMKQDRIDEKQVLGQLDKLMNIENSIKRLHFGLLIKIKNTLTSDQQSKLREMMKGTNPHPPGPTDGHDNSMPPNSPPHPEEP